MMTEFTSLQVDPDVLVGENENLIDALNHTQQAAYIVGNSVSQVSKVALQTAMENVGGLTEMAYEGAASLNRLAQDNAENIMELAHNAFNYTQQAAQYLGHAVVKTTADSLETAKVGAEGITEMAYESVASNAENIKELAHNAFSYTQEAAQNIGHVVAQTSINTIESANDNTGGIKDIAYGGAASLNRFAHDNAENILELAQSTIQITQQAAQTLGHAVAETSKATLEVAKQGAEGITEIAYGGVENLKKIAQTESVKDITHSALDYTQLAVHTLDNALDLTQKAVLYTTNPENIKTIAHNAINYTQQATKYGLSSLREISQEAINYTQQTVQTLGLKTGFNPSQDSPTPGNLDNQYTQVWENIVKKGQENIDKVQEITANAEKHTKSWY